MTGECLLGELRQTADRGEEIARGIVSLAGEGLSFPARLWQKVEALGGVDLEVRRVGAAFPELAALVEFFFQEQRNGDGSEIIPLARKLQGAYGLLRRLAQEALAGLNRLKDIFGLPEGGANFPKTALPAHLHRAGNQAFLPESEVASCR